MNRNLYSDDLRELQNEILKMSVRVKEMVKKSINALIQGDRTLAEEMIILDDEIDNFEIEIQEKSIKLMALQQPMAKDLREIFTMTKVISDLERIGDLSVNLSRIANRVHEHVFTEWREELEFTLRVLEEMIDRSLGAYFNKDITLAERISSADEEIDRVYKEVSEKMLLFMSQDGEKVSGGNAVLFAFKYIERMGDHLTNICEWTIYTALGKIVDLNE